MNSIALHMPYTYQGVEESCQKLRQMALSHSQKNSQIDFALVIIFSGKSIFTFERPASEREKILAGVDTLLLFSNIASEYQEMFEKAVKSLGMAPGKKLYYDDRESPENPGLFYREMGEIRTPASKLSTAELIRLFGENSG